MFLECCKVGLYWRGVVHDWQKFTPTEWFPYAESFYGAYAYDQRPPVLVDAFNRAWLHHIHHGGEHHWQHWILREDSGKTLLLEMPDRYRQEMICDWIGAGRAMGKYDPMDHYREVKTWYTANREKIQLNPVTRRAVERELNLFFSPQGEVLNQSTFRQ